MGQAASGGLTQVDVDDVLTECDHVFNQPEVESLYKRFRSLDRGRKGYISADEFLNIPELSINPLAQRLVRMFECVNFKDFVSLLAAFSPRASQHVKLQFMFRVYDVDGDGVISRDDLGIMLKQMAGSSLSEEDTTDIIDRVMAQAGCATSAGLTLSAYVSALKDADLSGMTVDVPTDFR